jgi:hypothetical protein
LSGINPNRCGKPVKPPGKPIQFSVTGLNSNRSGINPNFCSKPLKPPGKPPQTVCIGHFDLKFEFERFLAVTVYANAVSRYRRPAVLPKRSV